MSLVDLHTHTTESDGTLSPEDLIAAARQAGVCTLAITDHDTVTMARAPDIDLIHGIELTCKYKGSSVHLLGYFFNAPPSSEFHAWLDQLLEGRRDRNRRLARRLQDLGLDVTLEEAEGNGRRLTGRPHFARVLVQKGYAATANEAFQRYIGESGEAYVEREAPGVPEAVERIVAAGGVSSGSPGTPLKVTTLA